VSARGVRGGGLMHAGLCPMPVPRLGEPWICFKGWVLWRDDDVRSAHVLSPHSL
jgi:hypothetical protein